MHATNEIIERDIRLERTDEHLVVYREDSKVVLDPDRPKHEHRARAWAVTDRVAWPEIAKAEQFVYTVSLVKAGGGRLTSIRLSSDENVDELWSWLSEARPDLRAITRLQSVGEVMGTFGCLGAMAAVGFGLLYLFVGWGETWDVNPTAWFDYFGSTADEVGGSSRGSRRARGWLYIIGVIAWLVGWVVRLIGWTCELVTATGVLVLGTAVLGSVVAWMIVRMIWRPTVRLLEQGGAPIASDAALAEPV
jgi:hypothetical protein